MSADLKEGGAYFLWSKTVLISNVLQDHHLMSANLKEGAASFFADRYAGAEIFIIFYSPSEK